MANDGPANGEEGPRVRFDVIDGDLFETAADAIVNAWNRNIIPWWLLLPGGVSGQLKRRAGTAPFRELARHGAMAVGDAVLTGGGRLDVPIIHVAGLNMRWRASAEGVQKCTRAAVELAWRHEFDSLAAPIIGAGHGGLDESIALAAMVDGLREFSAPSSTKPSRVLDVFIVRWMHNRR